MKRITSLFVLVALAVSVLSGCAASPLSSRTALMNVNGKDVPVQIKGERGATTTVGLYVDGKQYDVEKTFSPFSSSYTFKAELEKAVLVEASCNWEATSNGWGQKLDCTVYLNNKEQTRFTF